MRSFAAIVLAGCAVAGGPQLSVSKKGVSFGLQGGVGAGEAHHDDATAFRLDAGFAYGRRRHGFGALSLQVDQRSPGEVYPRPDQGVLLSLGAGTGGVFAAAGFHVGWYGCGVNDALLFTFGARHVDGGVEYFFWPQYSRWMSSCSGGGGIVAD